MSPQLPLVSRASRSLTSPLVPPFTQSCLVSLRVLRVAAVNALVLRPSLG